MSETINSSLLLTKTTATCAIGEKIGEKNRQDGRIPVLSCEGACIRGEIARQAANIVAKDSRFRRACHGEVFTVPDSAIAKWTFAAEKIVLIDGCFLRCHGRIMENLVEKSRLIEIDALSIYMEFCDVFDIDAVPEKKRLKAAQQVANEVLAIFDTTK